MNLDVLYRLSRDYLAIKRKPYQRDFAARPHYLEHRLSLLIGQRGVGKTTLLIQHLLNRAKHDLFSKEVLYIPVDHLLLENSSLYDIAAQFYQLDGKVIALDEIHKYEDWSKTLKSIYDTFPNLIILASGSSALSIYQGTHDLSRRAVIYTLPGLSFREYLALTLETTSPKIALDACLQDHESLAQEMIAALQGKKILALFKQYLKTGYYPYALEMGSEETFYTTLEQNLHATLESDLPAIHSNLTGHSVKKLKQLLAFIAESVPFSANFEKLRALTEIGDVRTLKTYLAYLEESGLILSAMKASRKLSKIETPEKIYLGNPNQLYALSKNQVNMGTVREVFFLNMLSTCHRVTIPKTGDFLVDDTITFEIGGKNKDFGQLSDLQSAYLACDDIEIGISHKIPLWLFGFLY